MLVRTYVLEGTHVPEMYIACCGSGAVRKMMESQAAPSALVGCKGSRSSVNVHPQVYDQSIVSLMAS